jgi:hypothetical protein
MGDAHTLSEHESRKIGLNPRPSAIPPQKLATANRFVNLLRNKKQRDYGFAYLNWLKGGAVGNAPEIPSGLPRTLAYSVRMELDAMNLWENPRRARRIIRPKAERRQIRRFTRAIGKHGPKLGKALGWTRKNRPPTVRECVTMLEYAVKYLDHPDVQAIPFAHPASAVAQRIHHIIAGAKGQRLRKNPIAVYNPPPGRLIYGQVLAVEARKTNGVHRGKNFRHKFDSRVAMYALPDGSVLLKSGEGKRLWQDR